ncbi:MAG TPA: hypothetical protein VH114_07320 [Candidatus Acidoferrum sp.]|jgi:hypothetical protein|nr:hypothetical protein [Candidatus Acidoferrum sp.]
MFVALFAASFVLALALSITVSWISREAVDGILRRFVGDRAVRAGFEKYIRFAIVIAGVSGGTRVRVLQEYLAASELNKAAMAAQLTQEFWALEIYRTIIGTLEGIAVLLLVCIFLALIAPVVVRMLGLEPLKAHEEEQKSADSERRVTKIR